MSEEVKATEKVEKKPRRQFRNPEWTEEQVAARKAALTVAEIPTGWVKVSEVGTAARTAGIPVSKLVRAFGGDRGMLEPTHQLFKFVYVGRTRYVSGQAMTEGIALLKDPNFMKTTRVRKPKAEKAEKAESGPVAGAKADPQGRRVAVRPGK
jgi:hypothetical protein